jgi:hypothetical protein
MFTKLNVSQALIDVTKSIMEEDEKKKMLLEPEKDAVQKVQGQIQKKKDDIAAATGDSATVRESDEKESPFNWKGKPSELAKKPGELTGHDSKKTSTGTVYTKNFKKDKEEIKEGTHEDDEEEKEDQSLIKKMVKKSALKSDGGKETKSEHDKESKSHEAKETKAHEMSEERHMTDDEMKEREHIVKSMKKGFSGFKARYGNRAKNVMYATATKQAMRGEAMHGEELKGGQVKLDKNHNGKLDKQDFKLLRQKGADLEEQVKTTHKDPLVTVHHTDGSLWTHANLSTANSIHGTNVHHKDVHTGPVKQSHWTFNVSKHHAGEMEKMHEDIGGISTISEKKKKEVKEEDSSGTDMTTKTVETLAGRKKVPSKFHNQHMDYKVQLNTEEQGLEEGKGTDVDPNFVTDEKTPMNLAKELAKKSFKKIRTETMGKLGTSEEKNKW